MQGLQNFHNPHAKLASSTSDSHNFLIRTLIRAFLNSMERSLSLESNHISVNVIWCSQLLGFFMLFSKSYVRQSLIDFMDYFVAGSWLVCVGISMSQLVYDCSISLLELSDILG